MPLVWWVLRDRPADVGTTAYGAEDEPTPGDQPRRAHATQESAARLAIRTLRESSRSRTFWFLVLSFWICGWSTNGLIGTHFIPAAHDHGMPPTTSASLLALIGVFDIVGTVASGWLTDRVDSRYLLFAYYFLRGLSLLVVPWLLASTIHPSLFVFIVFYGLDWVATVPPTVALCRQHFGPEKAGIVFGWVFASHMVGAGIAASYAGWVRQEAGDYFAAWMTAGGLCIGAAALCLLIPRHPVVPVETDATSGPDVAQGACSKPTDGQRRRAVSRSRNARSRPSRAWSRSRRVAMTAARNASGGVPGGGGGATYDETCWASVAPTDAREPGSRPGRRARNWRTASASPIGSAATSAARAQPASSGGISGGGSSRSRMRSRTT